MIPAITKDELRDKDIAPDRVRRMSQPEIMALFERYGFEDRLGHPLLYCQDFLTLVSRATDTQVAIDEAKAQAAAK